MTLDELNRLAVGPAADTLLTCCGARRWAQAMADCRPFADRAALHAAADAVWRGLDRTTWLEAFAAHPRIGDLSALRAKFASTAHWASGEQGAVAGADDGVLQALADGNAAYERRFGHIFIVCATGKTAPEMLALLQARLGNDPDAELRIAAGEQAKITHLRLDKLLAG